jgi:hypothetical protein
MGTFDENIRGEKSHANVPFRYLKVYGEKLRIRGCNLQARAQAGKGLADITDTLLIFFDKLKLFPSRNEPKFSTPDAGNFAGWTWYFAESILAKY